MDTVLSDIYFLGQKITVENACYFFIEYFSYKISRELVIILERHTSMFDKKNSRNSLVAKYRPEQNPFCKFY